MSCQTKKILIFEGLDLTSSASWEYTLNANVGFFLDIESNGLPSSTEVRIFASSKKGGRWKRKILRDKKGKLIDAVPIPSGTDENGIEVNNFRADFIRVEIDSAGGGTIDVCIDYQENNNAY